MNRLNTYELPTHHIRLDQIDPTPGFCCTSFGFDLTRLKKSIQAIGLVNAPVLIRKMEGKGGERFDVISGFRRISALRSLSFNSVSCRILPSNISALECLQLNIHENLISRQFNPVEVGMALKRLTEHTSVDNVLKRYMPLMGLPSHEGTLQLFLRIEADFENLPKMLLADGSLSMKAAKLMAELKSAERELFCRYFSAVHFSKNQQTQFIDLVVDLSHMENISAIRLLTEPGLTALREDPQMNSPQKAHAIMTALRRRRLPRLTDAENRFKKELQSLSLPSKTHIHAPPFFEGAGYRLEMNFENGKELKKKLEALMENEKLSAFRDPWKRDF
jgi:hypothetical protein